MLITLEPLDLWREYIYWRNNGQPTLAFDYLRREHDTDYFEMLIATIARRRYGRSLKIGDWIRMGNVEVEWSSVLEEGFHNPSFPRVLKTTAQATEWS
jgi:hypothetical protein